MSDKLTLVPLDAVSGDRDPTLVPGGYATLPRPLVQRLARAMPDCQSAALLLIAWTACRNQKMKRGPLAGRAAASISGGQLAVQTGRPLRTVRYALRQLVAGGLVVKEATPAGRKNVYRMPFWQEPHGVPGADVDPSKPDPPVGPTSTDEPKDQIDGGS